MRKATVSWSVWFFSAVATVGLGFTACNADRFVDPPEVADLSRPPRPPITPTPTLGILRGKVVAPEGTIPISGALVYLTSTPPPAIPDGVFCDKCVHIADGTPHTTTKPDGTFELTAGSGKTYLVAQKGNFRRVRPIVVVEGEQQVPLALTTMPAIMDKANGDDVPKIAVLLGAWDPIEVVLARMGLQATITKSLKGAQVLSKDATGFAIYGLHGLGETSPHPSPLTLLTDAKELYQYHILFIPCSGTANFDSTPQCSGIFNSNAQVKTNLQNFVKQGGRIYASDWSYEYVRQLFPGFVSWRGENTGIGSACSGGVGDQGVTMKDSGLDAWLAAQAQSLSVVKDAWVALTGVHTQQGLDIDGKPTMVTPKVWVQAGSAPVTASFQHGCGRVLYTTYHTQPTSETTGPLESQALALLYLILEVSVCVDPIVIG
jgi:hypothetical protein